MRLVCLLLLAACAPHLVDVRQRIPSAILDIRYASPNNFLRQPIYYKERCLLRPAVADRLARVASRLAEDGLRLVLWDCYRPLRVQRKMWAKVPDERYVADPSKGSHYNRGAAVDVTLAEPSGRPLPMPTDHDDLTANAHIHAPVPEPERSNRERLRKAMMAEGFVPYDTKWWRYSAPEALEYDLLDEPL